MVVVLISKHCFVHIYIPFVLENKIFQHRTEKDVNLTNKK